MKAIDIERPFYFFKAHLANKENKRILFSGPFGSGKTYFLKQYANEVVDQANVIKISPVKYVVSQNEDIFEYIKADIALELLKHPVIATEVKNNFGEWLYIQQFLINRPEEIYKLLISAVELVDKETSEIASKAGSALGALITAYEKAKSAINKHFKTKHEVLAGYLQNLSVVKGSIYEDDLFSQTIRKALEAIKRNKENILVIDDLDRLDPEHIFRILNILSVHQDFVEDENKFGFDKIIVVCDVENIRQIYMHRYGPNVNFEGYIEKFYSTEIFHFTNDQAITLYCRDGIEVDLDNDHRLILGTLLAYFAQRGFVTVRSIVKHRLVKPISDHYVKTYPLLIKREPEGGLPTEVPDSLERTYNVPEFTISTNDFDCLLLIKLLVTIFGGYDKLSNCLNTEKRESYSNISLESTDAAIRVFGLLSHYLDHYNDPEELPFSYDPNAPSKYYGTNLQKLIPLEINILGNMYKPDLGWTPEDPYRPDFSLYSNKTNLMKSKIEPDVYNRENKQTTLKQVLSLLHHILFCLKNHPVGDVLGIVPK